MLAPAYTCVGERVCMCTLINHRVEPIINFPCMLRALLHAEPGNMKCVSDVGAAASVSALPRSINDINADAVRLLYVSVLRSLSRM